MILALAVFAATILSIVLFKRRIPEWIAALCAAGIVIALGVEPWRAAVTALASQWNVLLFFAGLSGLVAIADATGLFRALAVSAARRAQGSARRLLVTMLILAAIVTAFLTNDAAVLVLTPLVAELVNRWRLPVAPFAIGIALMANAASAVFPISNPSNFIIADAMHFNLAEYLGAVGIPALAALGTALVILPLILARQLRDGYQAEYGRSETDPVAGGLLAVTACAMLAASIVRFPVGVVCAVAALVSLAIIALRGRDVAAAALRSANLSLVALAAGFFVVVDALRTTGALDAAARLLVAAVRHDRGAAQSVSMALTALGANAFNNLPSAMIAAQIAHHASFSPLLGAKFAAGAILGLAVGPNLTTVGSLSTMLVLIELRRRGVDLRARQFAVPGAIVTVATLAAAALAFALGS